MKVDSFWLLNAKSAKLNKIFSVIGWQERLLVVSSDCFQTVPRGLGIGVFGRVLGRFWRVLGGKDEAKCDSVTV